MFARSVSEGTLVTTPNSGHYIQEDEPELVSWAIEEFFILLSRGA
jgi:pimeloyl-ACP methyl ester carboxylesterase